MTIPRCDVILRPWTGSGVLGAPPRVLRTGAAHGNASLARYLARQFTPAHADLADSRGVPARLANERYVDALARIVCYWAYPAVDALGRTSCWEVMKAAGPGATVGCSPARRRT